MKLTTIVALALGLMMALSGSAADDKKKGEGRERKGERAERRDLKGDIGDRVRDINRLDNSQAAKLAGLRAVSKETAVPVPTLEAQLAEHKKAGIAGLLVANEIATHTKKDAGQVLKAHADGRGWSEIAKANNESLDALEAKLARVESAMRDAK